jgi:hypothetical protein
MATNEIKMGINLRQNKNVKNAGYGKYYPEVDTQETLTLKGFAKHMSDHGSIYTLDIIEGVLKKITQCLPELISQGVPIRLDPLGTFLPTCSVDKPLNDIPDMEGADPNAVVKGVHIRFLPYGVEDENITSRRFKQEYCSLEFRNIIDTQEVTIDGKKKKVTNLTPIETAIAKWKEANGEGNQSGQSNQSDQNNQNTPNNPSNPSATNFALTIATSGSGSATVTLNGNALTSGSNLSEDDEVEISITPAEGQTPTATLNGSSIELTESEGVYTGNFAMPGQASTLIINTGSTGYDGGDGGDGLDKD